MRRQYSATTAHRALPVCECPALGMDGALQGQIQCLQCAAGVIEPPLGAVAGLGRWFVGMAVLRPVEEAVLGNHSAQSPACVSVARPGHAMGHCKVKCSLYSALWFWWSLNWVLWQGWAGGL